MNREEIEKKVKETVVGLAGLESCGLDMDLMDDIGLSSIEVMDLISGLEETYGIKIPSRSLRFVATVGDLVDLIQEKTGA